MNMLAQDRTDDAPDWMTCSTRGPWIANSLQHKVTELRARARLIRKSYNKDWMGVPTKWLADVYDEAADVFEARLKEVRAGGRPS